MKPVYDILMKNAYKKFFTEFYSINVASDCRKTLSGCNKAKFTKKIWTEKFKHNFVSSSLKIFGKNFGVRLQNFHKPKKSSDIKGFNELNIFLIFCISKI